jgi:hypothetical protein
MDGKGLGWPLQANPHRGASTRDLAHLGWVAPGPTLSKWLTTYRLPVRPSAEDLNQMHNDQRTPPGPHLLSVRGYCLHTVTGPSQLQTLV